MELPKTEGYAVPLVTFDPEKGFQVNENAAKEITDIKETVGVITVVGRYRTGKSFLLNRVILDKKNEGFEVGPTINACTKGLWVWTKPIEIQKENGQKLKVLVMDTEGIGAFDEDCNHDTKLFLLAMLMSSYMIYNSMGSIDEKAIENLSLIVNLSQQIQIKHGEADPDPEKLASYFPAFLWVVRDFALKLVDTNGNVITSRQYLENALTEQKGFSENIENKNRIRRLLRQFFKDRDCFTLLRPTEQEKDLQKLNQLDDSSLRPEFVNQMNNLRTKILKKSRPKMLNSEMLNGTMLVSLCRSYVEAINSGAVPSIENAWTYLCRDESEKAMEKSAEMYDKYMTTEIRNKMPVDEGTLKDLHKKTKEIALKTFRENAMGTDVEGMEKTLRERIQKRFNELKKQNEQKMEIHAEEFFEEEYHSMKQGLQQQSYSSFVEFKDDLQKLESKFKSTGPKGTKKDLFFKQFAERALTHAADHFARDAEVKSQTKMITLQQQVQNMERELQRKKEDQKSEKEFYMKSMQGLEDEKASLKILQDKFKLKLDKIQKEKEEVASVTAVNFEKKLEEATNRESQLLDQVKQLEDQVYQEKSNSRMANSELDTERKRVENRVQLLEGDLLLAQAHEKNLQNENALLRDKCTDLEKENLGLKEDMLQMEKQYEEQLKKMRAQVEKEVKQKIEQDELQKFEQASLNLSREKGFLESQLKFANRQLEDHKKLNESLVFALKSGNEEEQPQSSMEHFERDMNSVVQANKNLSSALDKMEDRCSVLERKNEKLKKYYKMFKNVSAVQCKYCNQMFTIYSFFYHLSACSPENQIGTPSQNPSPEKKVAATSDNNNSCNTPPFTISINQTVVKEHPAQKPYTEYLIHVGYKNAEWTVSRRYKMFGTLHQDLMQQFPHVQFPESSQYLMKDGINSGYYSKRPLVIEDRRKALQQYLSDLSALGAIRDSYTFKRFLGVDLHFPYEVKISGNQAEEEEEEFRAKVIAAEEFEDQQAEAIRSSSSNPNPYYKTQYQYQQQKDRDRSRDHSQPQKPAKTSSATAEAAKIPATLRGD